MGNESLSLGLIAAANKAKLDLFFGGYPITPASDILHHLSKYKNFGIKTFFKNRDNVSHRILANRASGYGAEAVDFECERVGVTCH